MKVNTESTKFERFRNIIGWTLTALGLCAVIVIGAIYGYHHTTVWVIGLLLIVSGIMIAKSIELANFLNDTLRF